MFSPQQLVLVPSGGEFIAELQRPFSGNYFCFVGFANFKIFE